MTIREGQQLGNYRLVNLLGQGSFGSVYLGEHVYLGTPAAVKVMNAELPEQIESPFRAEAQTLARLIHPYIVRILDFGMDGPTPFLVLDYAPNGTLRDRHPLTTRVPLSLIVTYVKQIAEALAFAHERLLVHRDIKPENLLLGRREEALVSDFGLAVMVDPSFANPTEDFAGTLAYMAPEQVSGLSQPASDQYSLGCVVYEWISGGRPFKSENLRELIEQQINMSPPSLCEQIPSLPPAIEQVVFKALEKNPQQRYATITDFALALEEAVQQSTGFFSAPTVLGTLPPTIAAGSYTAPTVQDQLPPISNVSRSSLIPVTLQKTKEEWLTIGNDYYDKGIFEEALLAYERALVIDPNFVSASIGKGITLRNLNRYDEALFAYDRALQLDPDNPLVHNNKSLVLNSLGRYRESLVFSQRALELNANYPAAYFNMGYALGELKRYEEEVAAYDRAIELAPDFVNAYNAKGVALNALGQHDQALLAFDKVIELAPNFAIAYSNKGYTLNCLQRYNEALPFYQRAIELNADYANAYQGLSITLDSLGRTAEAEQAREKAKTAASAKK